MTPDLRVFEPFNCENPDVRGDAAESASPACTSSGEPVTRSPSPHLPTRESSVEPICTTESGDDSPEPSSILFLREKARKKTRRASGVKPKAKARGSHLEMVRCMWDGCGQRLHVDYVNADHWGKHLRGHLPKDRGDVIRCRWGDNCGVSTQKGSMWKHVVVHQPKFKIRCPRGCGVFSRGDMMSRHLLYCPRPPRRGEWENGERAEVEVGEGEEGGKED